MHDQHDLGREVGDRQHEVEPRRLLGALDVEQREQREQADPEDARRPGPAPSGSQKTAR